VRVALFTSFHPDTGGGAVNLRTLLAHLPRFEVTWFHLGPEANVGLRTESLGERILGRSLAADVVRGTALWLRGRDRRIDAIVERILAARCERHWVVAMDEGIPVGLQLAERAPAVPLHVSVHDDQEHGMYGRSRRYRPFARLTRAPVQRLWRGARSVDVTSDEMADYYRRRLGRTSTVIHPVVSGTPQPASAPRAPGQLTVGHIGSIYSARELAAFLDAFRATAVRAGRVPVARFIGLLPRYHGLVQRSGVAAELLPHCEESAAVERLRACDFVYAMYPFDRASRVFVRTSLPTKLTTYVRAGRPILAHAPADSTLAAVVRRFGLGPVCARNERTALIPAIAAASGEVPAARFAALADAFYGTDNARRLAALLENGIAP
jgi:hypothetical protein